MDIKHISPTKILMWFYVRLYSSTISETVLQRKTQDFFFVHQSKIFIFSCLCYLLITTLVWGPVLSFMLFFFFGVLMVICHFSQQYNFPLLQCSALILMGTRLFYLSKTTAFISYFIYIPFVFILIFILYYDFKKDIVFHWLFTEVKILLDNFKACKKISLFHWGTEFLYWTGFQIIIPFISLLVAFFTTIFETTIFDFYCQLDLASQTLVFASFLTLLVIGFVTLLIDWLIDDICNPRQLTQAAISYLYILNRKIRIAGLVTGFVGSFAYSADAWLLSSYAPTGLYGVNLYRENRVGFSWNVASDLDLANDYKAITGGLTPPCIGGTKRLDTVLIRKRITNLNQMHALHESLIKSLYEDGVTTHHAIIQVSEAQAVEFKNFVSLVHKGHVPLDNKVTSVFKPGLVYITEDNVKIVENITKKPSNPGSKK